MKTMLHSGLRLTHEIMQDCLYNHSRMIYVAEFPCWQWYLEQVEKVIEYEVICIKERPYEMRSFFFVTIVSLAVSSSESVNFSFSL